MFLIKQFISKLQDLDFNDVMSLLTLVVPFISIVVVVLTLIWVSTQRIAVCNMLNIEYSWWKCLLIFGF